MGKRGPKAAPFWTKVDRTSDGCWLWLGSLFSNGYGRAIVDRKSVGAHRHAYRLTKGPIPAGMVVMHRCDNKRCVNPEHLTLGTPADNLRDMVVKGRSLVGERNPQARLTFDAAQAIRKRYASGAVTQKALADEFRVSEQAVWNVLHGRSWLGEAVA